MLSLSDLRLRGRGLGGGRDKGKKWRTKEKRPFAPEPYLALWPLRSLFALCWWLPRQAWLAKVSTEQHCLGPASIRSPQIPEKVSQFFVGQRARALSLGCLRMPAVVTMGNLPYMDIHGHSLGFVKGH